MKRLSAIKQLSPFLLGFVFLACQFSSTSTATETGGTSGGGGDATEMGVSAIRQGLVDWIETGAARDLKLPLDLTYSDYIKGMGTYLAPHAVVVSFVTTEQEEITDDAEQKVMIDGFRKSCRGFISVKDSRPHILCNSDRYPRNGAAQYRLIHHEYASLAGLEKNLGVESDYVLSNQLSEFGGYETVYRLHPGRNGSKLNGVLESPTKTNTFVIVVGQCSGSWYPGYSDGTGGNRQVDGLLGISPKAPKCETVIGVDRLPGIGSLVILQADMEALSSYPKQFAEVVGNLPSGTVVRILAYSGTYGRGLSNFKEALGTIFSGSGDVYAIVQLVDRN